MVFAGSRPRPRVLHSSCRKDIFVSPSLSFSPPRLRNPSPEIRFFLLDRGGPPALCVAPPSRDPGAKFLEKSRTAHCLDCGDRLDPRIRLSLAAPARHFGVLEQLASVCRGGRGLRDVFPGARGRALCRALSGV